ncbi:uncharacterized protein [Ptychodera flava]|uniref:uncharacterized protein n=1 Tax=Ptychodera flava TaxID=63121 RepID=UPI00396A990D
MARTTKAAKEDDWCIVEPTKKNVIAGKGILVARSMVTSAKRNMPIRVLNATSKPVEVKAGSTIGVIRSLKIDDFVSTMGEENSEFIYSNECEVPDKTEEGQSLPAHLLDLWKDASEHLDKSDSRKVANFLVKYQDVISEGDGDLGRTDYVKHRIDTGGAKPIRIPPRRFPFQQQDESRKQIDEMLNKGLIERSNSPWSAPVVLVKK